ncbi:transcriptional regulatory protein SrrA (plasmid) [Peptoclostridium acidaminophilum DSM 3953]|uniref:Stage 0 sporulation protein A homolog n=1 Tax=Peptoclostridium acidaminophilum DSM 3953 TaxID=1286171 RepID=W8UB01_PEPAC|nr:response regulator transcription factor [Peptoclostridium acidaminophilum]AHM57966.1 transcriptional regulatory protein SrrA [Peptoclostridium acidaminophilum DSM 3953]
MEKLKILLVEDEELLRAAIKKYLEKEGYEVYEAADGEQAIEMFNDWDFNFVLLDIMLPRVDGWSVMRNIRSASRVPVIMLSARGEEYDKLFGFELGVDDYMVKPFSPKELIARIKAVLSRVSPAGSREMLTFEELEINELSNEVRFRGEELHLTPKEYDLLLFLCKNRDVVFSRQQLLSQVWGYDFYGDLRTVDTHVKQLRDKLGESKELIKTVWGKGYKFKVGD